MPPNRPSRSHSPLAERFSLRLSVSSPDRKATSPDGKRGGVDAKPLPPGGKRVFSPDGKRGTIARDGKLSLRGPLARSPSSAATGGARRLLTLQRRVQLSNLVKIYDSANPGDSPRAWAAPPSRVPSSAGGFSQEKGGAAPSRVPSRADAFSPNGNAGRAFSPEGAYSPDGLRRAFSPDGGRFLRREDSLESSSSVSPCSSGRKWSLHELASPGAGAARLPAMLWKKRSFGLPPVDGDGGSTLSLPLSLAPSLSRASGGSSALRREASGSSHSPVRREFRATSSDGKVSPDGKMSPDGKRGGGRVHPRLQAALEAARASLSCAEDSEDGMGGAARAKAISPDGKRGVFAPHRNRAAGEATEGGKVQGGGVHLVCGQSALLHFGDGQSVVRVGNSDVVPQAAVFG
ncbi:hypothetical protein T484DRAFT_1897671 [Baffinella frigidus]|nr:hypothetical protein T484DRAFT_1897671 [Cryptophyta sp. CCMP2293]